MLRIIACIPAYNEEKTIASVVLKAMKYVDKVIVCDDGSNDMTGEIAERLGAIVIRHERNLGKGAAIRSLFMKAREMNADVMITLDADGQHDPDEIPKLLETLKETKADIVIGSRFLSSAKEIPGYRVIGNKILNLLTNAHITDTQCGFRAYNKIALELITPAEQGIAVDSEILLKARKFNLKIVETAIDVDYKVPKPSKHNPLYHGLEVALNTVKYMSIRHPLIFYGIPGFLALLVAIVFWIWTLQIFAATRRITTNITLVAIGATMVGLMLLTTAVILWTVISVIRERY